MTMLPITPPNNGIQGIQCSQRHDLWPPSLHIMHVTLKTLQLT